MASSPTPTRSSTPVDDDMSGVDADGFDWSGLTANVRDLSIRPRANTALVRQKLKHQVRMAHLHTHSLASFLLTTLKAHKAKRVSSIVVLLGWIARLEYELVDSPVKLHQARVLVADVIRSRAEPAQLALFARSLKIKHWGQTLERILPGLAALKKTSLFSR